MSDDWGNSFFETLKTKESKTMSNLIKIYSKNGKCLCKGCNLFTRGTGTCCPIAHNEENKELEGEPLSDWEDHGAQTTWCRFKHCDMAAGEQHEIWHNPGYRVQGEVYGKVEYMWVPGSIVTTVNPAIPIVIKPEKKRLSKLARLGIKI